MSDHFVNYIKIKKYKCFGDFSAQGFKRVNLISGKNNVGKTALMEGLAINLTSSSAQALIGGFAAAYHIRNDLDHTHKDINKAKSDHILSLAGNFNTETNIRSASFDSDSSGIVKSYNLSINGKVLEIPESDMDMDAILKNIPVQNKHVCFVGSRGDTQKDIILSFTAIQEKDRESDVNSYINSFDNSIENVKVIGGNSIQCKTIGEDGSFSYRSITEFGDGLRHYLSIITDLFYAESGYLFIDEIGSGVHYSSLDQLWEIILTLSKELNVQVFATTHSRECIESYCRVAERLKEQDISFTTLVRNKENVVKAIVRDYEVFTDSIHDNREVRGW